MMKRLEEEKKSQEIKDGDFRGGQVEKESEIQDDVINLSKSSDSSESPKKPQKFKTQSPVSADKTIKSGKIKHKKSEISESNRN